MLNSLCLVLGMDFKHTIHGIHPTLNELEGAKDASNSTIEGLANSIQILGEVKMQRWQRVSMCVKTCIFSCCRIIKTNMSFLLGLSKRCICTSFKISQVPCWRCGI